MRARTASALTAVAGAIVAAAVLGAPTAAQAEEEGHHPAGATAMNAAYPAPEPAIRVSSASIQTGDAVRLSGRRFLPGEPISISVKYRITPNSGTYDNPWGVSVKGDRRADDKGKFSAKVRLSLPGYARIRVTGKKSGESAAVTVRVLAWRSYTFGGDDFFAGTPLGSPVRHDDHDADRPARFFGPFWGGWSPFRLSASESGLVAGAAAEHRQEHRTYGADVVAGLLGLAALAGSALVTRRRRTP
ncbi:hypothetical protein KZZ52_02625 [Dactylosporangium sp. AC04546]|uniref:hypothetical protein n=1 Tax=Dactylosporangium sp. AC04546 TaxID=2862460 RepID=UPI001EDFCE66|nr:hypothetical protein [Dactylosporangium sp. AC04546]WVK84350.1 hypothetical protein KZZ52_02625 [Dactylosporangium sp. AC04546]